MQLLAAAYHNLPIASQLQLITEASYWDNKAYESSKDEEARKLCKDKNFNYEMVS